MKTFWDKYFPVTSAILVIVLIAALAFNIKELEAFAILSLAATVCAWVQKNKNQKEEEE